MPATAPKETLVVGSGAAGLTAALLLAKAGRRVTLLETQSGIGGYLRRFTRNGLRFDTGFHFTGGFGDTLSQILTILGLENDIKAEPLRTRIYLQETGRMLTLPGGSLGERAEYLAAVFPEDASAIRNYFQLEQEIVASTPLFDLSNADQPIAPQLSLYDSITLQEYFQQQRFSSPEVETVLGMMVFCHGTPPSEIPLAQHCRISCGLHQHLSRVEHGGDAFIRAFKRELERYQVKTRTGTSIAKMLRFSSDCQCQEVLLSNAETLAVEDIFFAVHPEVYLQLFPAEMLSPSLRRRYGKSQDTCSFFSIYAALDDELAAEPELLQYISCNDLNRLLSPGDSAYGTGMVTNLETDHRGRVRKTFTAFRNMHLSEVTAQCGPELGSYSSNPRYLEFKRRISEQVYQDVLKVYPHYDRHLHILASATPYTCRRYSPPRGSAYGLKIKIAESRLSGQLPVRNCYALGHHAIMPGILGTMLGAFLTFRQAVGAEAYRALIRQAL